MPGLLFKCSLDNIMEKLRFFLHILFYIYMEVRRLKCPEKCVVVLCATFGARLHEFSLKLINNNNYY